MVPEKTQSKTKEHDVIDEVDNVFHPTCGIGTCKPAFLQCFANIPCFVGIYSIISLISQSLNAYLGSQIPSIEKQFGLSSAYSGILMSFNDIGYLTICLFVSSLAPYVHIPRVLFAAFILYGLSGILCGMPHFISLSSGTLHSLNEKFDMANNLSSMATKGRPSPLCYSTTQNLTSSPNTECSLLEKSSEDTSKTSENVRNMFLAIFGIGMILQGVGKSLRGPFVTVYIDDNGEKRKTGFYIGIVIASAIAGPAIAFVVGGFFSRMYVTLEDVDIDPRDPRWIGAWWLGFIVFGCAAIVFSLPLMFFPRHMKRQKPVLMNGKTMEQMNTLEKLKERLLSFKRVLSNLLWMFLLIQVILHIASIGGYVSFLSKYIKIQFNLPLWQANMILAAIQASVGLGTFVGGVLTRMFKLTPRRTLGFMLTTYVLYCFVFAIGLFLGCDQPTYVGPENLKNANCIEKENVECNDACLLNNIVPNTTLPFGELYRYHPGQNGTDMCSSGCGCGDAFFPICGSNGINYHSPCYAGCPSISTKEQVYSNCTCIPDGQATSGQCDSECSAKIPFAVLCVLCGFMNALLISPGFIAKLRCVEDKDKATALGIFAFSVSVLGWMPAPIITGKIIDTTCTIWQNTCTSSGACLYYDQGDLRIKIHLAVLAFKVLSLLALFAAFFKVRKMEEWPQINDQRFTEQDIKSEVEISSFIKYTEKENTQE